MKIDVNVTITDIVAWWGAIVATAVLVWDVYKWRTAGPKLRLSVSTGMQTINMPGYDGKTQIHGQAVNVGDRPTTITNLAFQHYTTWWGLFRNRPSKSFIIAQPSLAQQLPFELKPGGVWSGLAEQTADVETMARTGYLVCELYHSHRSRPETARVQLR